MLRPTATPIDKGWRGNTLSLTFQTSADFQSASCISGGSRCFFVNLSLRFIIFCFLVQDLALNIHPTSASFSIGDLIIGNFLMLLQ